MSIQPIIISVQGGNVSENAVMVSVIKDALQERGFNHVQTDSGLPGDDRAASEHMLTKAPYLRAMPMVIEGLSNFDFQPAQAVDPILPFSYPGRDLYSL